jgi:hypothetical protein
MLPNSVCQCIVCARVSPPFVCEPLSKHVGQAASLLCLREGYLLACFLTDVVLRAAVFCVMLQPVSITLASFTSL